MKFKFLHAFIKIGWPRSPDEQGRAKTHVLHAVPLARDLHVDAGKTNFSSFVIRFLEIRHHTGKVHFIDISLREVIVRNFASNSHGSRKTFGVTSSQGAEAVCPTSLHAFHRSGEGVDGPLLSTWFPLAAVSQIPSQWLYLSAGLGVP